MLSHNMFGIRYVGLKFNLHGMKASHRCASIGFNITLILYIVIFFRFFMAFVMVSRILTYLESIVSIHIISSSYFSSLISQQFFMPFNLKVFLLKLVTIGIYLITLPWIWPNKLGWFICIQNKKLIKIMCHLIWSTD